MALVIVLAGGGSGGHIFPALALAGTIQKREPRACVRFVGTERGPGASQVRSAGYSVDLVRSQPVVGRGPLAAARALLMLAAGTLQALRLLRRLDARLVIGIGGYASVPTVAAAALLRIPAALLEPETHPGRANRLLGLVARKVFVRSAAAIPFFPSGRAELTGFPAREIPQRGNSSRDGLLQLLVVGGSQGARSINRAICAGLQRINQREGFQITHQAGRGDLAEVEEAYRSAGIQAEIASFFEDFPGLLARADLVVARAGASTVAEICMAGVPSILIPYPHAARDHQLANAREMEQANACVLIRDDELGSRLTDEIRKLAADPARRRAMAAEASRRSTPEAAARIWEACTELL